MTGEHDPWTAWSAMPELVDRPLAAASYFVADCRPPQSIKQRVSFLAAEIPNWAVGSSARRKFEIRLIDLIGGWIAHGHDEQSFAEYCARNSLGV